jgi:hypothetical protein
MHMESHFQMMRQIRFIMGKTIPPEWTVNLLALGLGD